MRPPAGLVLSCEHGGREVPPRWRPLFADATEVLDSHRGWDAGALVLARRLAGALDAPLVATTVSRLVVDANRSERHPRVFSSRTRHLDPAEREAILAAHHRPHREAVAAGVERVLSREPGRPVLHLGIHSFTPVLDGRRRDVDLGVLYDPSRGPERELARQLLMALRHRLPDLCIRANAPYRGVSDGLTTSLRGRYPARRYAGLELEVGQGLLDGVGEVPDLMAAAIEGALRELL